MKITKITKLPAYLRTLRHDLNIVEKDMSRVKYLAEESTKSIEQLQASVEKLSSALERLDERGSELEHMVSVSTRNMQTAKSSKSAGNTSDQHRFADNHLLDKFYLELENTLRGSELEVKNKQKSYIDLFKKTNIDYEKFPVIDVGSGRGEFLDLLRENDIRGIGVDLNESMVKRVQEKGFEAVYSDAIDYLTKAKSNSLGGVVGFHIAEHIPFEQLITLVSEARRALTKEGFLLLETPNPESLLVGAFTFHYDPSHLKPLPPALMEFLAKFRGFEKVEILRLQPELTSEQIKVLSKGNKDLSTMYERIFGPRDYALLAYK